MAKKITYTNKVDNNGITTNGKVWAADMNEIKAAVNENADILDGSSLNEIGIIPTDSPQPPPTNTSQDQIYVPTETGVYINFPTSDEPGGVSFDSNNGITKIYGNTVKGFRRVDYGLNLTPFVRKTDIEITPSNNIFNKNTILDGFLLNPSTGEVEAGAGFSISDFEPATSGNISFSGFGTIHHSIVVAYYNSSKVKLSHAVAAVDSPAFIASAPANTAFIRHTVKTSKAGDNTNIDNIMVNLGNPIPFEPYQPFVTAILDTPIAAEKAVMNLSKPESPVNVQEFLNVTGALLPKSAITTKVVPSNNMFGPLTIINNTLIDPTTYAITTVGATNYQISAPIQLEAGVYTISGMGSVSHGHPFRFMDVNGALISGVTTQPLTQTFTFTAPVGTKSFQMTVKTARTGDNNVPTQFMLNAGTTALPFEPYAPETVVSQINGNNIDAKTVSNTPSKPSDAVPLWYLQQNVIPNPTKGAVGLLFGDSITETLDANGNARSNWPIFAAPIMEITYSNYARSGASFTDFTTTIPRQRLSTQINDAIAANLTPSLIIVSIGTNDYQRKALMGDYNTAMSKAVGSLDRTLVLEAARWAFYMIRNTWPNARCFYALPIQRAAPFDDGSEGEYLRDPIKKMAERYNLTVIDAYSQSGIVKDYEVVSSSGRYLSDGLHPNVSGQQLMGKYYSKMIMKDFFKIN